MDRRLALKTTLVARGVDAFWADDRGPVVQQALDEIARRVAPDETVVVFPEGIVLDYLARRRSSVPYYAFDPFAFVLWGEDALQAALVRHPPDWVVLAHKDNADQGARFFGRDFARGVSAWIDAHYTPVVRIGAVPFQDSRFGMVLLRRHDQ